MSTMPSLCRTTDRRVEAIRNSAGAGFRLSLVLNAVKMKMNEAGGEISRISKAISEFSLMLKQIARVLEGVQGATKCQGRVATPLAVETVFDIKKHSDVVFDEIKSMTDLAQVRDEQGYLTEIGVGQQTRWSFQQHAKLPYLLGQLDYLKLNLAIMLQILQLGQSLDSEPPEPRVMNQERAEVQNMLVLQHWSFESLRHLYSLAREERPKEIDPPKYEEIPRLTISTSDNQLAPTRNEQEHPVHELDEALHQALTRENAVLGAPVHDLVDHLLRQWTTITRPQPVAPASGRRYQPRLSDDEEDTTESYSASSDDSSIRGRYLEGGESKKSVRFRGKQARVDDDLDENDIPSKDTQRKTKHILDSDDDTSESAGSSDFDALSTNRHRTDDRTRRPYISVAAPRPGKELRTGPPPARTISRPMAGSPVLRAPVNFAPGTSPGMHYNSQGNSPNMPQNAHFGHSRPPAALHTHSQPQMNISRNPTRPTRVNTNPTMNSGFRGSESRNHRDGHEQRPDRDRRSANRNLSKGIGLGAAAAGLMEILGALEGF